MYKRKLLYKNCSSADKFVAYCTPIYFPYLRIHVFKCLPGAEEAILLLVRQILKACRILNVFLEIKVTKVLYNSVKAS